MIDLAADIAAGGLCLQQALVVDGAELPVDTSFRAWLRFGRVLSEERMADPRVLLCDPVPGWVQAAIDFYRDEQELPRPTGADRGRALDLDLDAGLIAAAFRQAYGIDLTDPGLRLHWHLFLALLRAVPDETKLARVMAARTWQPADEKRKPETARRELRAAWRLPELSGGARDEALAYQAEWFGDVKFGGA